MLVANQKNYFVFQNDARAPKYVVGKFSVSAKKYSVD